MKWLPRLCALLLLSLPSAAQQHIAPTPPLGWNSWDAYGLGITEQQFRDNVAVLRDKLLPSGYKYAVIDEGWFFTNPEARPHPETLHYMLNPYGQYVPDPARFPSAASTDRPVQPLLPPGATPRLAATIQLTDFRALSDWVHAQGLQFGIHIVRGIPRAAVERNTPIDASNFHAADAADTSDACPWDPTNWGVRNNAAGQQWYDALMHQYAEWGVDLIKVDCISDHPYKADEIRMILAGIKKVGRPMVLSLSPGPTDPAHADEVSRLSTMWRISNDVWDVWDAPPDHGTFPQSIKLQFDRATRWVPLDLPDGRYPDLDMLPFGELRPSPGWGKPRTSRLTPDEEKTVLTLWALMRSPLIIGANLTLLNDATLNLLTNPELLRIDQHGDGAGQSEPPLEALDGKLPKPVPGLRVWSGHFREEGKSGNATYAALFNTTDNPLQVSRTVNDMGLTTGIHPAPTAIVYNVWEARDLGRLSRLDVTIPPHGVVLLESR